MSDEDDDQIPWFDQELPLINKAWSDKTLERKKREAATEVCASMLFMMEMGMLDIPLDERKFIMENGFQLWSECFFEQVDRKKRIAKL